MIDLSVLPATAEQSGVNAFAEAARHRPVALRLVAAVAVFLAGGVAYAAVRPDPALLPTPPAAASPAVSPAEAPVGPAGIPAAAVDPVQASPDPTR